MDKKRLQTIVDRIYDLPTLPVVVNKLIEIVGDPNSCANDVGKIIATDQSLTSKILKIVNSSFYGFRNPISTVSLAVVILGYKSLKSLALGVSVFDMFEENKESAFNIKELWEHSLAVGLCAKIISHKTKIGIPEEQFVCGLLHDIGEILFYKYAPEEFKEVISLVKRNTDLTILEAERQILDLDHTEIGEWLAEKWRLPLIDREGIKNHHDFSEIQKIPEEELRVQITMIYFADIFCKNKGFRYGSEDKKLTIPTKAYRILHLFEDDDEALSKSIDEEIKKSESYLEIKGAQGVSIEIEPEEK